MQKKFITGQNWGALFVRRYSNYYDYNYSIEKILGRWDVVVSYSSQILLLLLCIRV